MGGQAFIDIKSDHPINVPRMPPELYERVATDAKEKLVKLFNRVTIPREAPGKVDHGDIDFLVEGQRSTNDAAIWSTIKSELGAELHVARGGAHSFGVRHPDIPDAYVQVDVEISPGSDTPHGAELFEWTNFMKGDSDLLQIIGVCHRPLGITCNDRGLHVRVKEVEPYNKKKSLLYLTRDPDAAMQFYGLDVSKYRKGFKDEREIFDWVSRGRFFSEDIVNNRTDKSNDRQRYVKRPMYRRFIEEYMPNHLSTAKSRLWNRQEVLEEALHVFGKREQYNKMMAEHDLKEAEEALWAQIRGIVPVQGPTLGMTLKGLRRWVAFEGSQPYVTAQPLSETPTWTAIVAPESRQSVLDWVVEHWQEVKTLQKEYSREAREAATNIAGA